ncbi:MAG: hypothetical protein M1820_001449 [Bogoriella megaspora]|nr:MAG: hypothetical protein M1820_001449 [Bogoriella megaspora]
MLFLHRRLVFSLTTRVLPQTTRPFTTTRNLRLKEDKERSPESAEAAKQEQLKKQEQGKGQWHEELASAGETTVKAEREKVDDHGEHMEELQKRGKEEREKGEL